MVIAFFFYLEVNNLNMLANNQDQETKFPDLHIFGCWLLMDRRFLLVVVAAVC